MARDEEVGDEEAERQQHQEDAGPADRQHLQTEEAEDEGDRAHRAREDQAGVVELERDPQEAERHQQDDDVRVDHRVEDPLPERHLDGDDLRPCGVEDQALRLRALAVDLLEEGGQRRRDDVDHVSLQGLARREVRADADGLLRPVAVASVLFGDGAE